METNKNLSVFIAVLFMGLVISPMVMAKKIPTKGRWSVAGVRTLMSLPPEVSLEDQSLSIYFPGYLSDLTVVVEDENGNIVYSDIIFITPASPRVILLENMEAGSYSITLSHTLGNLDGFFEIE